jgi:hypothetical protein
MDLAKPHLAFEGGTLKLAIYVMEIQYTCTSTYSSQERVHKKPVKVSLFYHFVRAMANWNESVAGVMLLYLIEGNTHCNK